MSNRATPPRQSEHAAVPHSGSRPRRQYRRPSLTRYGDLRDLTLGGSNPLVIDSGGGFGPFPGP